MENLGADENTGPAVNIDAEGLSASMRVSSQGEDVDKVRSGYKTDRRRFDERRFDDTHWDVAGSAVCDMRLSGKWIQFNSVPPPLPLTFSPSGFTVLPFLSLLYFLYFLKFPPSFHSIPAT